MDSKPHYQTQMYIFFVPHFVLLFDHFILVGTKAQSVIFLFKEFFSYSQIFVALLCTD